MRRCGDWKWIKRTWTLGDFDQHVATRLRGWMRLRLSKFLWEKWRQLERTIQKINICWFSAEVLTLPAQQSMILERLLHRITSFARLLRCRHVSGSQPRLHTIYGRTCTTSFRNTPCKHCNEPWRIDISNFFPLTCSSNTVLASSAASEPQSHVAFRAVVSGSLPRF